MKNRKSIEAVLRKIRKADRVIIVGAGIYGKKLYNILTSQNIEISCFFDNNERMKDKKIKNIPVALPVKLNQAMYLIAVKEDSTARQLEEQLLGLGIGEADIEIVSFKERTYEYMKYLDEKDYKKELDDMYAEQMGKHINWENPRTYNEKINYEKLYLRDERRTRLADKYLIREWIKEKIGEQYQTKLYGVWENAEEINFGELPKKFVLKANNGSGRNIIVTDKEQIDIDAICKQLNEWKKNNFYYAGFEYQYKNIQPKIICEEYLEGLAEEYYDYDIYCFHGEPKYIWCINGSHRTDCKAAFYDVDWNKQTFSYGYPLDEEDAPRPKNLEKILELSGILARDFDHVRVDWYEYPKCAEGFLFSEMTFSTWGGTSPFSPEEYDMILGDMI